MSLLIKVQIIIYNSISLELIYKDMLICLVLICSPDVWKFPPLPLSFFFSFLPLFYLTFDSPSSHNFLCSSLSLLPLLFYSPISLDFYPFLTQIYRNIIFNKKRGRRGNPLNSVSLSPNFLNMILNSPPFIFYLRLQF